MLATSDGWETGTVRRWCSRREIREIADGEVKNMDALDLAAIREGQAESLMRGYAKKPRVWQLEEP